LIKSDDIKPKDNHARNTLMWAMCCQLEAIKNNKQKNKHETNAAYMS